jgi:UDP-glucose 4-epimerase
MHRMLITGGAGFIGSHICDAALGAGYTVTVLDDLSSGRAANLPPGVRLEQIDLRDREGLRQAVLQAQPDVISHHAAQVSVAVSVAQPFLDAEVNIIGLLNVLEAAREAGTRRFVFASSGGAIHGEVPMGQMAQESWLAAPISPYAASKLSGEAYLQAYRAQFGLQVTSLRYANVYGPRQNPHGEAGVVAVFCRRLLAGEPLQIHARSQVGDEGCERDYVYVRDIARANLLAAQGKLPQLLNIGTGVATSTRSLALALAGALGRTPELRSGPPRAGDIQRSVLGPASCLPYLGELTLLKTGLEQTLAWFSEQASLEAQLH